MHAHYLKLFLIGLFLAVSGCARNSLSVYTEIVDYTELASFHINTPDPSHICPDYGQRLHISWNILDYCDNTEIRATLRLRDLTEVVWVIPVNKLRGMDSFTILNDNYDTTGGLLTYKIDLINNGQIIQQETHALWTELILFPQK